METPIISFVVAMGRETRAIGKDGDLLWRIPEDQKHFKAVTMGHPMIMGRKTFESIGRVLPGRTSIVVTRNLNYRGDGVTVVHSVEDALKVATELDQEEVCIIGGEQIFALALPYVTRIYLTEVDDDAPGDTYFPAFEARLFTETMHREGAHNDITYTIRVLEKNEVSPAQG